MSGLKIAVVGSVAETRTFTPPVSDPAAARQACQELGVALAEAGLNLVVYSEKPTFVEADVVHGYLRSGKCTPRSVQVRAPLGKAHFAESTGHPEVFDVIPDPSGDWEVSFYRSLMECDGILLVGGGQSTFVTGLIALTLRIPIIPIATFGGKSKRVWERLATQRNDATEADIAAMANDWCEGSARRLVEALTGQRDAREQGHRHAQHQLQREAQREHVGLAVAALLLLAAVAALALVWGWQQGTGVSITALVLAPTLAGAAGALIRTSLDTGSKWARSCVLGGAAGLITGLLYVASQLLGAPEMLATAQTDAVRRLLFFVLPIGFVAGLTFDAIYTKLRGTDVSHVDTLNNL